MWGRNKNADIGRVVAESSRFSLDGVPMVRNQRVVLFDDNSSFVASAFIREISVLALQISDKNLQFAVSFRWAPESELESRFTAIGHNPSEPYVIEREGGTITLDLVAGTLVFANSDNQVHVINSC